MVMATTMIPACFNHQVRTEPDSKAVYRVIVSYQSNSLNSSKTWFVLQPHDGFVRLCKLLRKNVKFQVILKRHNYTKVVKRGNILTSMLNSKDDYLASIQAMCRLIFSQEQLLHFDEVQSFFAIDRNVANLEDMRSVSVPVSPNEPHELPIKSQSTKSHIPPAVVPQVLVTSSPTNGQLNGHTSGRSNGSTGTSTVSHSSHSKTDSQELLDLNNPASTESKRRQNDQWGSRITKYTTKASTKDFTFLKVIGKGSFGKVLLAQHKMDRKYYAVKVLHKQTILRKNEQMHIMAERNVLTKNLTHPFLVGLHYSFQTADKLYFILDYANGGELFFHLQKERSFSEDRSRFYAAEIGSALGYMHSQDILYRDLKPENLLLDREGHIVLTDFGLCKEQLTTKDTTGTFCGTPEYLAPEVITRQPYGMPIDWWCFGCVLYEMMYGLPPFYSRDVKQMYQKIVNDTLAFKPRATTHAKSLLRALLQKKPDRRMGSSARDFEEIKEHEFFRPINWQRLLARDIKPPFNPKVADEQDLKNIDPSFKSEPLPGSVINPRLPGSVINNLGDTEFAQFSFVRPDISEFDMIADGMRESDDGF